VRVWFIYLVRNNYCVSNLSAILRELISNWDKGIFLWFESPLNIIP